MNHVYLTAILLLVLGCTSTPKKSEIKKPELEDIYISGGTEKFMLGDIPYWANFSRFAKCQQKEPIKYINFENIQKSYNLDYTSTVHMQHMLNRKISNYVKSSGQRSLPSKDETFTFNTVYAQVLGKSYDFIVPKFTRVSVIWIDPFLDNKDELKKIMNNSLVLSGHPAFISHCLGSRDVDQLIKDLELDDFGIKVIPSEMFSRYDKNMKKIFDFEIDLSEILKNKVIYFFGLENPGQIKGITKFNQLKIRGNDV